VGVSVAELLVQASVALRSQAVDPQGHDRVRYLSGFDGFGREARGLADAELRLEPSY